MKKLIWLVWITLPSILIGQSVLSRISVSGNKFVNETNQTIQFRGYNSSDPDKLINAGKWNQSYFNEIKAWGANIVRFPIHPTAWRKHGKLAYLKLIDQGVEFAKNAGLYVIIDWHSIGNLRSEMFQADMYETTRKETFEFWRTMASKYKENTTVAFFELYNEPTIFNGQLGTCTWEQWKSIMEEIIVIVRANGATKTIPLIAGFNWAYDLTPIKDSPINATGIAYVAHPYPQKREKPWEEKWTADWGYVAEKYPVILTEIGFSGADDIGAHIPVISDESYGDAMISYCKKTGISFVVWVFDKDWAPRLFSDWDYTPSRQGKFWKKALKEW